MDYIIHYIFLYGWLHILIFMLLFLLYLPVLSLRVVLREKSNKKDIKFKQILIEIIIIFILLETFIIPGSWPRIF